MIPALLGIIAPSFAPVTLAVTSSQAVAVPGGASTVDIYIVQPGGGGEANQGNNAGSGGPGGNCDWDVALSVAGQSSLYLGFFSNTVALWGVNSSGTSIPLRFTNPGGAGGLTGGTPFGGGGGGAATELGAGGSVGAGDTTGGTSVTAGSVLASYVGHGGTGGSVGQAGFDGVGWGAGGGGAGQGPTGVFGGQGGPSGVLLIFK